MFLILALGSLYTVIYQNVSATGDEIVSRTIEINDLTANGPVLNNTDYFGISIANIGDLNNDDIYDIAVGAILDDAGGPNRGVVHILFMNSNGTVSRTIEINNNTANGPDLNNSDLFGYSIANIGDLNNDGIYDIAVGARLDDTGGPNRGVVHILFMNSNGTVSRTIEINNLTANGPDLNDRDYFGTSIANIGDLNNDGIYDIAVGAVNDNAGGSGSGTIHVMFMNSNGSVSDTIEINNNTANGPDLTNGDHFGTSIANIGDLNNDGIFDIAVGAINDDAGGLDRGVVHILFMNSNGTVSRTIEINDLTANGPELHDNDYFGSSIANIGDLNNDGIFDIAVGAYSDDAGSLDRGVVHILFMNSNGTVSRTIEINDLTANGPNLNTGDQFGSSIANIGDLNNDGIYDIAVGAYLDDAGGTDKGTIHVMFMNSSTLLPAITNITSNATSSDTLKVGDTISFTLTLALAENGATINGIYNSVPLSWNSIGNGTTYTATYTISEGDADQITALQITNVTIADSTGSTSLPFDGTDILNTIDANSPVITLNGSNPQIIGHGMSYTELNATTNDGSPVTINSANFTDAVGTYHIYYDSIDISGNSAIQINRTVIVSDTTPPVITLLGDNPQTIEQGAGYTELDATTSDNSTVTINSTNFTDAVGTYYIYYDSTDAFNNTAQVNRTVNVVDTTPPVITLLGDNPQTIEQGAGYTELDATTSDNSTVTINSTNFTDIVGTYTIYYDSTDAFNNTAQVNRTVNVVDTTPPVITLLGDNPQTIEQGAGYTELDATTSDNSTVTINSTNFTDIVGTYTIYYDSTDAFNNTAQVNRTVNVVDTTPPVITLLGDNPQTIEQGAGYTELNTTTSDNSPVTINSTNFTDIVGTYTIYYDSTDAFNNTAQVNRTVNVVDTTPPIFSSAILNKGTGIFIITFNESINTSTINPAGFSIRNNTDTGGVTLSASTLTATNNNMTVSFNISQAKLASIIAFTTPVLDIDAGAVRDIFDNAITLSANNTITTTSDTIPPVISLTGDNPQTIEQGAGYTELDATTSDNSTITINSANFTDIVGTYTIYYDSTDTAGNNAIQVIRTVIVVDTTPPTFSSAVLNEGTGTLTITFSEIINASSIISTGFSIRDNNNTSTSTVTLSTLELTTTANSTTISFNMTMANRQSVIAFTTSVLDIDTSAVQDINGNAITMSANNTITTTLDTIPPVISLLGDNPQTIELGDDYTELSATTSDGSPVTIDNTELIDAVGTYSIYYDSTDTAGNNAIQVIRTVIISDTTPPTFSSAVLNEGTGALTITFSEIINASSINSTGFSIRDNNNNTSTSTVTLSNLELTTTANGTTISFNMTMANRQSVITFTTSVLDIGAGAVQDINGHAITLSANNTITTTLDTIPPVISLLGDNPQTIELGDDYTELNATTSDGSPVTINNTELIDAVGTYSIYYDSTDTAGNNAIQVNRTVIISDTTPPTFSSAVLNEGTGALTITFSEIINASSINSTGFSIRDNNNNTNTGIVTLSTLELTTTTNSTTISFNMTMANRQSVITFTTSVLDIDTSAVQDINGNAITLSANNIITTTLDTIPPVISLLGDNPQTIELGDDYTELSATTSDGSPVTIDNTELIDAVGTYPIYYDSTDTAGNNAIQVIRTVIISDTTPPTFSSAVLNEGTGILTITFSETINASTINSIGFSIRDNNNNTNTGIVTLSNLELTTTANGTTISFNMTMPNRQSVITFTTSVLDIGAGAVQDINGHAITMSANNIITTTLDTIPPVISLLGDNPQTIELGDDYTELSATTSDGSPVTIDNTELIDAVGTYSIYYDSTDTAGNNAIQVIRTVIISDTTPPTFSSAVLNEGTGILTITFSETINASTINSIGFSIRDNNNNTNTGIVTLSNLELTTTANGDTISFNMTMANRQSVIAFNVSVLDIDAGAVRDISGNTIIMSTDNSITTTLDTIPPILTFTSITPNNGTLGIDDDIVIQINANNETGLTLLSGTINNETITLSETTPTSSETTPTSSFGYRKTITINNTMVSGSAEHTNFPLLVSIQHDPNLNNATIQASGQDIRFTTINDTPLHYEITSFSNNHTSGNLSAWIMIPTLYASNDTKIYMYYSNSIVTDGQNATAVWDSDYDGVWHFDGDMLDSTSNDNDGTNFNSIGTTGIIGGARSFDGNDYISYSDSEFPSGNSTRTLSAWVNHSSLPANFHGVLVYGTGDTGQAYGLFQNSNNLIVGGYSDDITLNTTPTTNDWYHFAMTYDGTTVRTYIDGSPDANDTKSWSTILNEFRVGQQVNNFDEFFSGQIDEIRISDTVRTADWIKTEYNNQNSGSFYSVSAPEKLVLSFYYDLTYTVAEGDTDVDDATVGITYNITLVDTAGNPSTLAATLPSISSPGVDANSPVITLNGLNPQIIEQGAGYIELNATTNDGSTITINSANFTDLVGTYHIYYDSTDTAGNNAIQVNRTVIVSDTTPPVITLNGTNPQTIELGDGYTELNATTNDGSTITINSANFTDAVGNYTIYYDSTDTAGNNAIQVNRTVIVSDTTPPAFSSAVLNEGTGTFTITFSEIINASTINSTGFSIRDNNTSTGTITLSTLELTTTANGTTISFNMTLANRLSVIAFNVSVLDIGAGAVQDINGNAITLSANNIITTTFDSIPPVISLIGDNPQTIEQGAGYTELNATASDGSTITINSANFTDAVGNYTIYYDSTDTAGNSAIQVNRTVNVVDTTPPAFSSAVLNEGTGIFTITFSEIINASTINSTGFSIRDNNNNTSTGAVTLSNLELTTTANGATISFNMTMANRLSVIAFNVSVLDIGVAAVRDIFDNAITLSANNTITTTLDTIPPVISLIGENPQTIEQGAGYTELNATTNDGSPVNINSANFTDLVGTYYIYYDSTDAFNNTAQVIRTVIVVDNTLPVFSSAALNEGTGTLTITFSEAINASSINSTGFSIRDNNTSIDAVTLSTLELITTANDTTISFNMTLVNRQSVIAFTTSVLDIGAGAVQDIYGNQIVATTGNPIATTSDTIPPVISLLGNNPQTIEQGAGYTELGATTNDNSTITINSANFTDTLGTYTIYYDSADISGNNAIQVNRTVIVSDTIPPVITLNGANPQTIELGDDYTELGATTNDDSPVTINSANFTDILGTYTIYYDSVDASGNNAIQVNRTVIVSDTTPSDPCVIPDSGDWIITNSCTLDANAVAPESVIVQNGSVLNIPSGITLNIDFTTFNLTVQSGGGVLIKSGGTLT